MSSDLSSEFQADLLDDFYAECDESLGYIRDQLTQLEAALRAGRTNTPALESIYRHLHSFKGNSAIVGLQAAESLAHAAEGMLRSLSRGETQPTADTVDLLGQVATRLEQLVTAHRLKQPQPSTEDLLAHFAGNERPRERAPQARTDPEPAPVAAEPVVTAGADTWRATFRPSAALEARGMNINTVRTRLGALGEIVSGSPSIEPGGGMTFNFVLALRQAPADTAAWEADGIVLRPAGPAAAAALPGPAAPPPAPSQIVRVDLGKLDELMRIVGEMVIHRSRLEERIARVTGDRTALQEVNLALARSLRELREGVTRVRLVPIAEIFSRLPFVVRDLARETEKQIRVELEGQDTEVDKYLVERLREPLLHLVRNAISHGIETPAERLRAGKPAEATVRLHAATSGQSVEIRIRDDGRGVDAAKVAARAAAAGIALPDTPHANDLLHVICRAGFSTRDEADRAAGRGVGMAVVQNTLRELGGSLSLETEPGQFTQFTLRLPLTLSIAETFLVSAAGQTCAVPQGFVEEVLTFAESDVRVIQAAEIIPYRDGILPLVRLRQLFGAAPAGTAQTPLLVIGSERGLCGLVVDKVLGQREVVVRSMHDPLLRVPGISGATELGDGRPVLILDAVSLSGSVVRPRAGNLPAPASTAQKIA